MKDIREEKDAADKKYALLLAEKIVLESRLNEAQEALAFNYATIDSMGKRLSQAEAENAKLRDALRPFANMSECIENDKDFHIDGDCWIKAKEVLRGM